MSDLSDTSPVPELEETTHIPTSPPLTGQTPTLSDTELNSPPLSAVPLPDQQTFETEPFTEECPASEEPAMHPDTEEAPLPETEPATEEDSAVDLVGEPAPSDPVVLPAETLIAEDGPPSPALSAAIPIPKPDQTAEIALPTQSTPSESTHLSPGPSVPEPDEPVPVQEAMPEPVPAGPETVPAPETLPEPVPAPEAAPEVAAELDQTATFMELEAMVEAETKLAAVQWEWEQSLVDLSIRIGLPADLGRVTGKALSVTIAEDRLTVRVHQTLFISWKLHEKIKLGEDESQWTLQDGKEGKALHFDLTKQEPEFWAFVVEQRLPRTGDYFLSQPQVDILREMEIKAAPQAPAPADPASETNDPSTEAPAPADPASETNDPSTEVPLPPKAPALDSDGILLEPETEADVEGTTAELFLEAVNLLRKREDITRCVQLLRVTALRGHVKACHTLFKLYVGDDSFGLEANPAKGLWFLRHAARQGDVSSCIPLARFYEIGHSGLPISFALSVHYYQQAAQLGDTSAMCDLATMLVRGNHLDGPVNLDNRDGPRACKLLDAAIRRGCYQAMVVKGNFHLMGTEFFPQDLALAENHFNAAVKLNPQTRTSIPFEQLQMLKRAEALMNEPGSTEVVPQPSPAIAPTKAAPKPSTKTGKLVVSSSNASQRGAMWGGPTFWEKAGTVLMGAGVAFYIVNLIRS
eukprot:NODE_461_length_2203_cov_19.623314_g425_i0.p1 GENE.NODE_461_length_2203_cov_19.623314_g425_i0~~NODE_461_length_2203_cov_19.623314_g425_i0.p1  ORF type:complete len:694 (+),score=184.10 NODE_461_length_2203_cov_19.623314_g425_i0:43-2124(+)